MTSKTKSIAKYLNLGQAGASIDLQGCLKSGVEIYIKYQLNLGGIGGYKSRHPIQENIFAAALLGYFVTLQICMNSSIANIYVDKSL